MAEEMEEGTETISSTLMHHFRYMGQYNKHCTQRLLKFLRKHMVGSEDDKLKDIYRKDIRLFFRSIHGTLNHLLGAEQLWYSRIAGEPMPVGVCPLYGLEGEDLGKAWEERVPDCDELFASLTDQCNAWNRLLFDKDDSWCMETITYIDTEGFPTKLVRCAGLSQAFNHGTHHRGQISAGIHQLGLKCPSFDLQTMKNQFADYTLKDEGYRVVKEGRYTVLTTPRKKGGE